MAIQFKADSTNIDWHICLLADASKCVEKFENMRKRASRI